MSFPFPELGLDPRPQFVFDGPSLHLYLAAMNFCLPVLRFTVKVCLSKLVSSAYFCYFFKIALGTGCVIVTVSTYINSAANYRDLLFKYKVGNK